MTSDPSTNDLMAARCARTCKRGDCTGRGSTRPWAHRCLFFPAPPPPVCTLYLDGSVCGAGAEHQYLVGWRCPEHAPPVPTPWPSTVPSPSATRAAPVYGTATTDPRPGK